MIRCNMTHKYPLNNVDLLLEIMSSLRAPGGCPWDAEQSPESLTPYIIEEACELVDAIESGDNEQVCDELGDLLLQVVFIAQIFNERDQFNFDDVAKGISDKLIRRHPHVFDKTDGPVNREDLDKQWEEIKKGELLENKSCMADHLPSRLPTIQYTQKLISKAHKKNRRSELPEFKQQLLKHIEGVVQKNTPELNEEQIGQAIFHLIQLAYTEGIDAETALRKTTRKILQNMDENRDELPD